MIFLTNHTMRTEKNAMQQVPYNVGKQLYQCIVATVFSLDV